MIRIGTIWDRTVDVLQGRGGILTTIAFLTLFLPAVASGAFRSFTDPGSAAMAAGLPIGLAVLVLMLLGMLAITAVASDPAVDRPHAFGIATRRLPATLGILLLLAVAGTLLVAPAGIALVMAGATFTPAGAMNVDRAAPGPLMLAGLLFFVFFLVALWLSVKLVPLFGVIVNERLGIRAVPRSFRLTRGSTLKLIGVLILYVVVCLVVASAANAVTGVVARLLLGAEADATVAFLVAIVSAALTALATVVQTVFYAQFYVAAVAREGATATP